METTSRNKNIVNLFMSGLTLQEIGNIEGITRERVRQILHKELSVEPYLEQIQLNRQNRPHKLTKFTKMCPKCGKVFSGRVKNPEKFTMCVECRKIERRARRTATFVCQNCGKVGTYKTYKKAPTFCSNQCKLDWLHKIVRSKSVSKG